MTLWTTPAQAGPGRITKVMESLEKTHTPEELQALVAQAVESSREEVERMTKPYRDGWKRTQEICRPFWRNDWRWP